MHYSTEAMLEIEQGLREVLGELQDSRSTLLRKISPKLTQERAREFVGHGVCRRLLIIERCIRNIFEIFPARRKELLNEEERTDVEISLHAFLINSHGVPDNLAWAYVLERKLDIGALNVGLFKKSTQDYLPADVRAYLTSISTWRRNYAKNYRDALAHRVPPYVPPSIYTSMHQQQYAELYEREGQAIKEGNWELALELQAQKHTVGIICPAYMHSFSDATTIAPMILHPQLIADARTVMQIIEVVQLHLPIANH